MLFVLVCLLGESLEDINQVLISSFLIQIKEELKGAKKKMKMTVKRPGMRIVILDGIQQRVGCHVTKG